MSNIVPHVVFQFGHGMIGVQTGRFAFEKSEVIKPFVGIKLQALKEPLPIGDRSFTEKDFDPNSPTVLLKFDNMEGLKMLEQAVIAAKQKLLLENACTDTAKNVDKNTEQQMESITSQSVSTSNEPHCNSDSTTL